jgi:hypothetical protein
MLLLFRPRTGDAGPAIIVTGRFDRPSPAGASGDGSPEAGVFDSPSPGVTNA